MKLITEDTAETASFFLEVLVKLSKRVANFEQEQGM